MTTVEHAAGVDVVATVEDDVSAGPPPPDPARLTVWLSVPVGTVLVAVAYAMAGRETGTGGVLKYVVFWAGMLVVLVPMAVRMCSVPPTRSERLAILATLGLYTFLPKFLRNPNGPLFFDELAHERQTSQLVAGGELFAPNAMVDVVASFPGLHAVTAAVAEISGLSVWRSGLVLLAIIHVAATLGVFVIARRVTRTDRFAGIAALLYCVNPAFWFFNSQFAYQSLGIVFFLWVMVCALEAANRSSASWIRWGWVGCGIVLAGACTMTHHVSSYVMILALAIAAPAQTILDRHRDDGPSTAAALWTLLGAAVAMAIGWALLRGGFRAVESLVDYLAPNPGQGAREVGRVATGSGSGRRAPFSDSGLPVWERAAAFVAPLLVLGAAAFGVVKLWRAHVRSVWFWVCVGLTALYAFSLPFVLTAVLSERAHRTFPFTYVGVAVVAALGIAALWAWAARATAGAQRRLLWGLGLLIAVVAVGNLASNANEFYRFPGVWVAGSDTRNLDAETAAGTDYLATFEPDEMILTDHFNGTSFVARASTRQDCAIATVCPRGLAVWGAYFADPIPPELLEGMLEQGYGYLVVDLRFTESMSRTGWLFTRGEPERSTPVTVSTLRQYDDVPWAIKIYASDHLAIYRIDFSSRGEDVDRTAPPPPPEPVPAEAANPPDALAIGVRP